MPHLGTHDKGMTCEVVGENPMMPPNSVQQFKIIAKLAEFLGAEISQSF